MLKKLLVMLFVASLVSVASGDIITTYADGTPGSVIQGQVAVQHFTVPTGWELNNLKFNAYAGNNRTQPINAQIFDSAGNFQAVGSNIPWGTWFFIEVAGLNLGAGDYYVQAFSNNANAQAQFGAVQWHNTSYTDGHAATGWSGGTPVGDNIDFQIVMDMTVPEPATMSLLAVGCLAALRRRRA